MAVLQVGKMRKKLGMPNKEKSEGPLKGQGQATELSLVRPKGSEAPLKADQAKGMI